MSSLGLRGRAGAARSPQSDESSLVVQMAARLGRDSIFYSLVMGMIFPLGLVNAIVLTHYLTPSEYGQLGILFFVAGLGTTILNLLYLRGTEGQVWGTTDEGASVDVSELAATHERPRVLGTGLAMSIVTGVLLVAAVVPLAPDISRLLLHTSHLAAAVVWTAASAGLGCIWRLVVNIGRWERRRKGFGTVWMLRPVLALAIAWPLVAAGDGVAGAMAATAIGTLMSMLLAFAIWRRSYRLALDGPSAGRILRRSAQFSMMMIGLYVLHSGDVFMLSRYAGSSQVGIYKLATNISVVVSYAVSAFLMAWSPLEFTPLFRAAYERHGTRRVRAEFTHYYLILGVFMVLVLVALAAPIMSLFRSSYRSAEGFVAITSAGFVTYGLIMTVARNSAFPRRYLVYGVAAIVSALGLVVTSLFLGGPLGGYGVATGDIIGGFLGTAVIVTASAIWGTPPEIDIGRMAKLALVAGTCYGIAVPLASATGLQAPLKLASVIAFLLLIFATGVIPASQRHRLWEVSRAVLLRHVRPSELTARAGELPAIDRQIVQALACERQSLGQVVAATGLAPDTVRRRLVSALRRVADIGEPSNHDLDISEYLLAEGSVTERDAIVRALEHQGVDLADLHRIELVWSALRRSGRPATALTTTGGGPRDKPRSPDLEGWALDEQSLALLDDVVRSGCSSAEVADRLGVAKQLVQRRLVSALRIIAGDADPAEDFPHPGEALMAAFLFDDAARTPAAQLWAAGIDPLELHRLELARATVRRASRSNWRRLRERAGAEHAVEPVPPADLGMTDPSG